MRNVKVCLFVCPSFATKRSWRLKWFYQSDSFRSVKTHWVEGTFTKLPLEKKHRHSSLTKFLENLFFHVQTKRDLEALVDELNAGRPQCPVGLNTLVIPRKLSTAHQDLNQPYVYLNCGHVQGEAGALVYISLRWSSWEWANESNVCSISTRHVFLSCYQSP